MCGRFDQHRRTADYAVRLGLPGDRHYGDLSARYNVAPSETSLVARWSVYKDGPELVTLRWGLVPHWSKDPTGGPRPINARAETVSEKPFFRDAFRASRCLVPADGFFEWRTEGARKQPYYFRLKSGEPMCFAGLWSRWRGQGQILETFTIIVTNPNRLTARIHNRMPAILPPELYLDWLDPQAPLQVLQGYLAPYSAREMEGFPVSTAVGKPQNKGADVVTPTGPPI